MSAATLELTDTNFEEALQKGGILLVDFWAGWCRPCLAFAPVYEAAAARHPDIVFAKVNTEEQPGLAGAFEVRAIPTLAVFRDGILLGQNAGALPVAALEELIKQVRDVDMDKVKQERPAQSSGAP